MNKFIIILVFVAFQIPSLAQQEIQQKAYKTAKMKVVDPKEAPTTYAPLLKNLEAPAPGGDSYKSFLGQQKTKSALLFPGTNRKTDSIIFGNAENPIVSMQMPMRKYIAQIDREGVYYGGTPLDNTMATNGDYLLASVNSFLWAYDLKGDSNLFVDEFGSTYNISFAQFGKDYITDPQVEAPFDPKLMMIPGNHKFIFIFLSGRTPTNSKIIVGFSTTTDPRDPWNVYMLPGNPRNVDQWTDFPMAAFDDNNLYLSINLLKANTSWQAGFKGSIVWQVPLIEGFQGDSSLNTVWYDNITYNGSNIRNLTPVQEINGVYHEFDKLQDGMTFYSNRNFDIQNDSLFQLEIRKENPSLPLKPTVSLLQLPKPYGMPPNGIQGDDNPNDQTDGLQTNDARFLRAISYLSFGGVKHTEFVGNTKNFSSGRSAIYHGIITDTPNSTNTTGYDKEITANVIGVDSLDFGYPGIAHVVTSSGCYEGSLIGFNHTSATTFAGISAIRHDNVDGYSDIIRLKEGDNYVRRISGSYERWGDYFGIQRDYSNPESVYMAGFYGTENRSSSTWFSKLHIPSVGELRTEIIKDNVTQYYGPVTLFTENQGGYPPYTYLWSDSTTESSNSFSMIYDDPSFTLFESAPSFVIVTDSKGCKVETNTESYSSDFRNNALFPNPVTNYFSITFHTYSPTKGRFEIYDMAGKRVVDLGEQTIQAGNNVFSFSARPLGKGSYFIRISDAQGNELSQKSFIKL
tara:strand:+ start:17164 stop:19386 length:2223 start_codon:yes stop_codon:yes gene_type:complete